MESGKVDWTRELFTLYIEHGFGTGAFVGIIKYWMNKEIRVVHFEENSGEICLGIDHISIHLI